MTLTNLIGAFVGAAIGTSIVTWLLSVEVELCLDLDEIAGQLGYKALRNKSRKSKLMNGAITARIAK